jgi:uncharacterized membrane protein YkoI
MKQRIALVLLLLAVILAGCGRVEPSRQPASEFVQAVTQAAAQSAPSATAETPPVPPQAATTAASTTVATTRRAAAATTAPPATTKPAAAPQTAVRTGEVTLEQAIEIALQHANVRRSDVVFTVMQADHDPFSVPEFEVEFIGGGTEYKYAVRRSDGTILYGKSTALAAETTETTALPLIGLEKAKEVALQDAELTAEQVRFTKEKQDKEDGIQRYRIEFKSDTREYEYIIHAATGVILDIDAAEIDD